jgi:methyl-accepting chemotaxis protein
LPQNTSPSSVTKLAAPKIPRRCAIAAAVQQQDAVTQEISRNVQQAAHGTTQVAHNIADVNRGASETGSAASQVLASARSLAREGTHLKLEVEKFLTSVRAA